MNWYGPQCCCDYCSPNEVDSFSDDFSATLDSTWQLGVDTTAATSGGNAELEFSTSFATGSKIFLETNPNEEWVSLSAEVDVVDLPPNGISFGIRIDSIANATLRVLGDAFGETIIAGVTALTRTPAVGDTFKMVVEKTGLNYDLKYYVNGTLERTVSGSWFNESSSRICSTEISLLMAKETAFGPSSTVAKFDNYDHAFAY